MLSQPSLPISSFHPSSLSPPLSPFLSFPLPPFLPSSLPPFLPPPPSDLVAASLITSGLGSVVQCMRFRIPGTKFFYGTGLITVVGTGIQQVQVVVAALKIQTVRGGGSCSLYPIMPVYWETMIARRHTC